MKFMSKYVVARTAVDSWLDEPDDAFILRADFVRGVRRLLSRGLAYDILVFQRQLANAIKFVDAQADDQQFVLDHVGKPMPGREGEWAELAGPTVDAACRLVPADGTEVVLRFADGSAAATVRGRR